MTDYRLHWFPQSGNAYKVAMYLDLVGSDWEPVVVDFFDGATRAPEWRASINEMGEVPVLEHDGHRLSQSGVILHYLADRIGRFGGATEEEKLEIWRWILFDNHKFTGSFATYRWLRTFARPAGRPGVIDFLRKRADAALAIVEKHLEGRQFIVTTQPTIADLSLAGYLYFPPEETGYDLPATHPNIHAWTERIAAMPGWRHPYDLSVSSRAKTPAM